MAPMPSSLHTLLEKYDRPVPRYTSYPTVPQWKGIQAPQWQAALSQALARPATPPGISLYVHVPYCHSLCAFCACTKKISRDPQKAAPYVDAVLKEFDIKDRASHSCLSALELREIHLGGGTPTWLPPKEFSRLVGSLRAKFGLRGLSRNAEISVEVDPRTFTEDHGRAFEDCGIKRVSVGVQDFHLPTLRAIKRFQTREEVEFVLKTLRKRGISEFNFDLVYGLPRQTLDSVRESARIVCELRPSRLALYSYAHLPTLKPAQKGLEKSGLPTAPLKRALYEEYRAIFLKNGYVEIGMDHFALSHDPLARAAREKRLHRNFMGYTVAQDTVLIGLGPSALSDVGGAFAQNDKDVDMWLKKIANGDVTPSGGHVLTPDELWRRERILELMCRFETRIDPGFWQQLRNTEPVRDGLLEFDDESSKIRVSPLGRVFLRNICALFDLGQSSSPRQGSIPAALYSRSI